MNIKLLLALFVIACTLAICTLKIENEHLRDTIDSLRTELQNEVVAK